MEGEKYRQIYLYKDYFTDFFVKQKQKVRDKILWVFRLIETQKQIPAEYLKHLSGTDGLFEIRVQTGNDIYRIFCFLTKEN